MKQSSWIDNLVEEKLSRRLGLKWTVGTIKVGEIDQEASLKNMGRLDKPLDSDWVQELQNAMDEGCPFPRIFVHKKGSKSYVIDSGNHRFNAALKRGITEIEAYILNGTEQDLEVFARCANGLNGKPSTRDERVEQAMALIQKHGFPHKQAAKLMNLKEHTLNEALRAKEVLAELLRMGIENAARLKQGALCKLHTLMDNENVFRHAGELVATWALPVDDVHDLCKEIRVQRTEAQRIGVVGQWQEKCQSEHVKRIGAGIPLKTRTKFLRLLRSLTTLVKQNASRSRLQLDADELPQIREEYEELNNKLSRILGVGR